MKTKTLMVGIAVFLFVTLTPFQAFSRGSFGGSRSGGFSSSRSSSFSSSSRSSSFGGSRSSGSITTRSSGGTIFGGSSRTTGASAPRSSSSSSSSSTTVINRNYYGGGYGGTQVIHTGPSWWEFWMWNSMMNHPQQPQVVVVNPNGQAVPGAVQGVQQVAPQEVILQQPESHWFRNLILMILGVCLIAYVAIKLTE